MTSLKVDQKFQAPLEKISGYATVTVSLKSRILRFFLKRTFKKSKIWSFYEFLKPI